MIILTQEILEQVTDNKAFIVLIKSIAKRASFDKYQSCFPSISTIEDDTGLSRNSVLRALKWLESNGIIQITRRKNKKGENMVNNYKIDTPKIKVIGNLKAESSSATNELGSATDELGVVPQMNYNLKSILTSSPYNKERDKKETWTPKKIEEKIEEIRANPFWDQQRKTFFSGLSEEEINLKLGTFLSEYPKAKITTVFDYLGKQDKTKYREYKQAGSAPTIRTKDKLIAGDGRAYRTKPIDYKNL